MTDFLMTLSGYSAECSCINFLLLHKKQTNKTTTITTKTNQRTDSPKSLLACKVLMECCVSSMQFYTIHAKKIDDIPMLPILYDKMELYGIYQASGHCTS